MITIHNVQISSEEVKDLLVYYALDENFEKFSEFYKRLLGEEISDREIARTFELMRRSMGLEEILQSGVY